MRRLALIPLIVILALQFIGCSSGTNGMDEGQAKIREARAALNRLYAITPASRALGNKAKGVLVFPEITKAGFVVGGQYGNGVLFKNGQPAGFYNSTAAFYGLQAGAQQFGYALFFMNESDLDYLSKSAGWEVGVGPSITVVDEGFAKSMTTTTLRDGVYVFFFEQRGLMGGLGIQGTKITRTSGSVG